MKNECRILNEPRQEAWCMKHNCYYKIIGYCTGPIRREHGYYSYANCPDKPEQGGIARCGMHEECRYCRDLPNSQKPLPVFR